MDFRGRKISFHAPLPWCIPFATTPCMRWWQIRCKKFSKCGEEKKRMLWYACVVNVNVYLYIFCPCRTQGLLDEYAMPGDVSVFASCKVYAVRVILVRMNWLCDLCVMLRTLYQVYDCTKVPQFVYRFTEHESDIHDFIVWETIRPIPVPLPAKF